MDDALRQLRTDVENLINKVGGYDGDPGLLDRVKHLEDDLQGFRERLEELERKVR